MRLITKLMISLSLTLSLLALSCQPKIQVGPSELPPVGLEQPTTALTPHLSKPVIGLTAEQFNKLPRNVRETLVKREHQWDGVYKDYLLRP